jgi:hypothetical protein
MGPRYRRQCIRALTGLYSGAVAAKDEARILFAFGDAVYGVIHCCGIVIDEPLMSSARFRTLQQFSGGHL